MLFTSKLCWVFFLGGGGGGDGGRGFSHFGGLGWVTETSRKNLYNIGSLSEESVWVALLYFDGLLVISLVGFVTSSVVVV